MVEPFRGPWLGVLDQPPGSQVRESFHRACALCQPSAVTTWAFRSRMRAALTAAVCSVMSCAPWGARSCTMPGALHSMLLSWFLFCVSCVASRYASAPPFSSRRLFLSLAPFAAALLLFFQKASGWYRITP